MEGLGEGMPCKVDTNQTENTGEPVALTKAEKSSSGNQHSTFFLALEDSRRPRTGTSVTTFLVACPKGW